MTAFGARLILVTKAQGMEVPATRETMQRCRILLDHVAKSGTSMPCALVTRINSAPNAVIPTAAFERDRCPAYEDHR